METERGSLDKSGKKAEYSVKCLFVSFFLREWVANPGHPYSFVLNPTEF